MNLLPEDYNLRRDRTLKTLAAIMACLLFASFLFGYNLYLEKTIAAKIDEKAKLDDEVKNLASTETVQNLLIALNERIEAKAEAIKEIELSSPKMIPVLNVLESNLPYKTVFTSLNKSDAGLTLAGIADSQTDIAEFLHNLKKEDVFLSVTVSSITKAPSEDAGLGYYFSMQCEFKQAEGGADESI